MAALRVRVTLPSGVLSAELRGRSEVTLTFEPPSYYRFSEDALEDSLGNIGRLLCAARVRAYYEQLTAEYGREILGESEPLNQSDVDYRQARSELAVTGRSSDGRIELSTRGMHNWKAAIAPGTLSALKEEEFCERFAEAARDLIENQYAGIARVKAEVYR